jgi:hypothetical protein
VAVIPVLVRELLARERVGAHLVGQRFFILQKKGSKIRSKKWFSSDRYVVKSEVIRNAEVLFLIISNGTFQKRLQKAHF